MSPRLPVPTVLAVLAVLALGACSDGDGGPQVSPTPRDLGTASPADTPSPAPSASLPDPAPTSSASPSPSASPTEPADPTDADRARFIARYQPEGATDLEHAAADVDGDEIDEIVFVYVRTGARVSHVDVAWWDEQTAAYEVRWGADGGPAERVDRLRISDVNADGRTEVVVSQSVGSSGASLTLWRADDGSRSFSPLVAQGGCHAGSNTYGVIGASLTDDDGDPAQEIVATCDDSPLPPEAWNSDVYDWDGDAYVYARTRLTE